MLPNPEWLKGELKKVPENVRVEIQKTLISKRLTSLAERYDISEEILEVYRGWVTTPRPRYITIYFTPGKKEKKFDYLKQYLRQDDLKPNEYCVVGYVNKDGGLITAMPEMNAKEKASLKKALLAAFIEMKEENASPEKLLEEGVLEF